MHPWHSVQMGAFRSLPPFAFFQKTIPRFMIEFFMILHNTPGFWLLSLINQEEKKELLWRTSLPIAQYKGLQDGSAPQNFSNKQIKTFPEIRRWHQIGDFVGLTTTSCQIWLYFSPSCVSYLCLILFFSDVPERTLVCFRSLSFCVSYLFVFFIPCRYFCESFGLFSIPLFLFVSYLFVLLFLADVPARVWRAFCPSLSLCFLTFCASVPCRCSCNSFGVFSVPLFLCVSYVFVLLFLADVPARVWRVFRPSLSLCFLPQSALPQSHCTPSNMSAETNLREKILPTKVARTFFSLRNCLSHQTCAKKMQTFYLDLLLEFAVDRILRFDYEFDTKKKINWTKELSTSQTILFVVSLFGQLFPPSHFSHYTDPIFMGQI